MNNHCTDALLNLLQMNYDSYLDVTNVRTYDRPYFKEQTNQKPLEGLISDDMKMYALDIVFMKKIHNYNTGVVRKL